ncbi:alkaline phosphatase-like protein [Aspergillus uvarum CBS 121591]|uniref:GPI ethanolamine phosphate transferase 2 n=1 Tax=Aspergillus uvarum CBS 121591 TaxID=1448315 RepID=A0A319CQ93_9EURO|nr:alkaline phosphatase-like protein [Aspergillus uvarum CBS 121591]PYH86760.1 alkaline phosphatase-like protein [Aspergillus uvarum CBS 121591]
MGWHYRGALLILANGLILASTIVFTMGFFRPIAPSAVRRAPVDRSVPSRSAPFERVVFMMIDALRSDFVYSPQSEFAFTQELIRSGAAIPFTMKTDSPSLTRACIKAMTVGSASMFLDVFHNADDGPGIPETMDTWLARLKAAGRGQLVFYGDDTWVQLFPEVFDRGCPISPLFVPDIHSSDLNVSTNVMRELQRDDWSALVLHFPGIDHVGHMGGADSEFMASKQRQMDVIIREIYEALETEAHLDSTIFVAGGDHGMDRWGGHGGASDPEVSAAMIFISPQFKLLNRTYESPAVPTGGAFDYYTVIRQVDVVPTMAGLLGVSIPSASIGVFVHELLDLWSNIKDQANLVLENLDHLQALCCRPDTGMDVCQTDFDKHHVPQEPLNEKSLAELSLMSKHFQNALDNATGGNIQVSVLHYGIAIAMIALLLAWATCESISPVEWDFLVLNCFQVGHGVALLVPYLVETEHHFWFWSSTVWMGWVVFTTGCHSYAVGLRSFTPFVLHLLSQQWNIHDWSSSEKVYSIQGLFDGRPLCLWLLIAVTFLHTSYTFAAQRRQNVTRDAEDNPLLGLAHRAVLLVIFVSKFASAARIRPGLIDRAPERLQGIILEQLPLTQIAQFVFVSLAIGLGYVVLRSRIRDASPKSEKVLNLYLTMQTIPASIPLLLVYRLQLEWLVSSAAHLGAFQVCFSVVLFTHSAFFAFGNANTIAALRYTEGFNGLQAHHWLLSPVHTFCSNYAGPIWWSGNGLRLLIATGQRERSIYTGLFEHLGLRTVFVAYGLLGAMGACYLLREEAIVWTVMAPKFLYTVLWTVPFHLLFNMSMPAVLWMVAQS